MAYIGIENQSAPATPNTGYTDIYVDSTAKTIYSIDDAGAVTSYSDNYSGTYTVAASGGDYTTIQAALDANVTASILIVVYPGTYTNDTINFTANAQTVMTPSKGNNVIVTNSSQVVEAGDFTGCKIKNIRINFTPTTAINGIEVNDGSMSLDSCKLDLTTASDIAGVTEPALMAVTGTGTLTTKFGEFTYQHTGDTTNGIKAMFSVANGGTINCLRPCTSSMTNSGTAAATSLGIDSGTGLLKMANACDFTITDTGATVVAGLGYIAGSGANEFEYCKIKVVGGGSNACYGIYNAGTGSIRSMHNVIEVVSGTANYSFFTGASATTTSICDDIRAVNGSTGTGPFNVASSDADGSFTLARAADPHLLIRNITKEDGDGGRESSLAFEGLQSGGEQTTLAKILAQHDGTSDDQKGDLIFYTNDGSDGDSPTERLRIDSAGLMSLTGSASLDGAVTINESGNDVDFRVEGSSDANTLFVDGGNNRVGIGTAAPETKLSIKGTGSAYPAVSGTTQSAGHMQRLSDASALILDIGGNATAGVWLQSSNSTDLSIGYPLLLNPVAGNVGIGTTSPSYTLELARAGAYPQLGVSAYSNDNTYYPTVNFFKSRGAAVGTLAATSGGDYLGFFTFKGVNTSNAAANAAYMIVQQDGAGGATYIPGRITFNTGTNAAAPAERMIIDSSGNVGIGTSSPDAESLSTFLHIANTSNNLAGINITGGDGADESAIGTIEFSDPGNTDERLMMIAGRVNGSSATPGGDLEFWTQPDAGALTKRMTIDSSGNVGIGDTSPSQKLVVADSAAGTGDQIVSFEKTGTSANAASNYYVAFVSATTADGYIWNNGSSVLEILQASDRSLKTNIKDADYGLKEVMALRPVNFDWKEDNAGKDVKGFIAQEVQEVLPKSVSKMPNGHLGLGDSEFIPILVKAIQELKAELDELRKDCQRR